MFRSHLGDPYYSTYIAPEAYDENGHPAQSRSHCRSGNSFIHSHAQSFSAQTEHTLHSTRGTPEGSVDTFSSSPLPSQSSSSQVLSVATLINNNQEIQDIICTIKKNSINPAVTDEQLKEFGTSLLNVINRITPLVSLALVPLTNPPLPLNNDLMRSMFVYIQVGNDPLATTISQQALINFCGTYQINQLFLDMYLYLGLANTNATKRTTMRNFLDTAGRSGISVTAYAGDPSYAINQSWVKRNIILPLNQFQQGATLPTQRFSGLIFDTEYWTDPLQTASTSCKGLCNLMNAARMTLQIAIGCFATYFLKDNTATRPSFAFQGKTAQDGTFLMDNSDFVVVGAFRNHATDNGTDGPDQISLFNPWYTYVTTTTSTTWQGRVTKLQCCADTHDPTPEPGYVSYFGNTKTYMESQFALISNTIHTTLTNSWFDGEAINEYVSYGAMAP
jgi:hypothetical protein